MAWQEASVYEQKADSEKKNYSAISGRTRLFVACFFFGFCFFSHRGKREEALHAGFEWKDVAPGALD